jgi:uncharacterized membrane protein YfcA
VYTGAGALPVFQLALIALAGFTAGAVNALAGGGTLISFPALLAAGFPALTANIANTIALCPGYLGATWAQRADLHGQRPRLLLLLPIAMLGGVLGAALLLRTGEHAFASLVPWLILLASGLLALQGRVRAALRLQGPDTAAARAVPLWSTPLVGLAAIYGGYFGAGMSVMMLAVLALALSDALPRLNALKQALALGVNAAAAIFLAWHASVPWSVVAVLAISALLGGAWGGRFARRLSPALLQRAIVSLGVAIAVIYWLRRQ